MKRNRGIFLAAGVAYVVQAIAWPLDLGRDGGTFLQHYFDLLRADSVLPQITTYRTPLPALWFGVTLSYVGVLALEILHGLLFVIASCMAVSAARPWGRTATAAVAAAMVTHTWYGGLYHRIDSDGLFAFLFVVWLGYAIGTADRRTALTWVAHAVLVFALVMIRPAALVFALFAAVPLVLSDRPVRVRATQTAAMALTVGVLLGGWSSYNYLRYGFFGVSRLTYAAQPFLRVFIHDRLVRSRNGPASRELSTAVEQHLLPHEPYRSLGMSADQLLANGTMRIWSDVVVLSDSVWGWESRYAKLRDVSIEAIRANPGAYTMGVLQTLVHACIVTTPTAVATSRRPDASVDTAPHLFPDLVPYSYADWTLSTPDGRYHPETPDRAIALAQLIRLRTEAAPLQEQLPPRDGVTWLSHALNRLGLVFAPMLLAIGAGALGLPFLCLTNNPRERVLCACWALSLLYLAATFAGQVPAIIHYRLPFDPLFVLTGVVGASALLRGRLQLKTMQVRSNAQER